MTHTSSMSPPNVKPPRRAGGAAAGKPAGAAAGAVHRAPARRVAAAVDSLRRIVRALRVAAQRTHAGVGVSAAQHFVLRQLAERPAASLSELGDRTLTDRSSVADVVDRLAERRLVRRSTSATDRRRITIAITPSGRALLERAPEPPTAMLIEGLEKLDPTTLDALAGGLERLTQAMGIAAEPAMMLFEEDGLGESDARRPGSPNSKKRGRGARAHGD